MSLPISEPLFTRSGERVAGLLVIPEPRGKSKPCGKGKSKGGCKGYKAPANVKGSKGPRKVSRNYSPPPRSPPSARAEVHAVRVQRETGFMAMLYKFYRRACRYGRRAVRACGHRIATLV
eukprot:g16548.t1